MRTVRDELRAARRLLKENARKRGGASDVANVSRLLGISPEEQGSGAGDDAKPGAAQGEELAESGDVTTNAAEVAVTETSAPPASVEESDEERESRMERDMERAIELWKLRSDVARSTFLANAKLSDEDAIDFDVLMEAMNIRLAHAIEEWVKGIEAKEEVGAEEGVRLLNDVTEALVLTYDAMDRKLPEDWRETGGKGMRLFDFIDPSVAKPMVRVEDRLDDIGESFGPTEHDDE